MSAKRVTFEKIPNHKDCHSFNPDALWNASEQIHRGKERGSFPSCLVSTLHQHSLVHASLKVSIGKHREHSGVELGIILKILLPCIKK